jgi:hypothetical protein
MTDKEKHARFIATVQRLGGDLPIAEWTARSGIVGFAYNRRIYRAIVRGNGNKEEMDEKMERACKLAFAALECLRDGTRWIGDDPHY